MKVISHGAPATGGAQLVARHGVWPFCFYRIYYGSGDHWTYKSQGVTRYATGYVRAKLTAHYWRFFEQSRTC